MFTPGIVQAVLDTLDAPQLREERAVPRRARRGEQCAQRPVHAVLEREHVPPTVVATVAWYHTQIVIMRPSNLLCTWLFCMSSLKICIYISLFVIF